MAYVKTDGAIDGNVVQYPYSLSRLKVDFPNTSFPRTFPADYDASSWGVYKVEPSATPAPSNPNLLVVEDIPTFTNGVWIQTWAERLPDDSELEAMKQIRRSEVMQQFVSRISSAATAAGATDDDLSLIGSSDPFSAAVMTQLFANDSVAFRTNVNTLRSIARSKNQDIIAATTISAIQAVNPADGWPS